MGHLLILGRGWVGSAVEKAAAAREGSDVVTAIDPPFDPILRARDQRATAHLRKLITELDIGSVINACGRIQGSDEELLDANVHFVEWLCEALDGTRVRLVHIGSASEYGDPGSSDPISETTEMHPVGAYATTKATGTRVVLDAAHSGLDATVARVFNIVGFPVPPTSPIHQWLSDIRSLPTGMGEIVVWWPETSRDFVLLDDVARSLIELSAVEAPPPLVNICSGRGLRYGDIAVAIGEALGTEVTIRSLNRPGIECVVGDPNEMRRTLGWVPTMSTELLARVVVGTDRS